MNRFFRYHLDHVLFWALTVFFHALTALNWVTLFGYGEYAGEIIIRNTLLALLIYSNLFFVFPLFTKQSIFRAILFLLASLILYATLKVLHEYIVFKGSVLTDQNFRLSYRFLYNLSIATFYLGFVAALHLSKQWYLQREQLRQIRLEKLNTELDYLKAQMNPHFLFNSINTIFFQINKENTEARETLGKFSDMLRYQLYECNADTIPVEKEIAYLQNYVALQQLRKDELYTIDFQADSHLRGFNIPPLLLIPFIENTFKHISNHTDRANRIEISLRKQGQILELNVINTTDNSTSQEPGGIGLKNVQRRLELLYPNKHTLAFEKTGERFSVLLKLILA